MLYMLDTNICIYLMQRKSKIYFEKLEDLQTKSEIVISSIVYSELQFGVENSQHKEKNQANLNLLISQLKILPYTEDCAYYYGKIRAFLEKKGRIIGANDLLIASHAIAQNAILVTNNGKEFSRVEGLIVENW